MLSFRLKIMPFLILRLRTDLQGWGGGGEEFYPRKPRMTLFFGKSLKTYLNVKLSHETFNSSKKFFQNFVENREDHFDPKK